MEQIRISPRPTLEQKQALTILHLLMTRQVSGLADCIRHVLQDHWDGYREFAMTELADMSVLVERMSNVFELDVQEVYKLGKARDAEKRENYLVRHPNATWY